MCRALQPTKMSRVTTCRWPQLDPANHVRTLMVPYEAAIVAVDTATGGSHRSDHCCQRSLLSKSKAWKLTPPWRNLFTLFRNHDCGHAHVSSIPSQTSDQVAAAAAAAVACCSTPGITASQNASICCLIASLSARLLMNLSGILLSPSAAPIRAPSAEPLWQFSPPTFVLDNTAFSNESAEDQTTKA